MCTTFYSHPMKSIVPNSASANSGGYGMPVLSGSKR